jgi:hypothetical protein
VALECNIDSKGRAVRLTAGSVVVLVSTLFMLAWALPSASTALIVLGAVGLMAGAFMIFEARAGWCALRALGIKTRL